MKSIENLERSWMPTQGHALLGVVGMLVLIAGCAVGPDYQTPKTNVPGAFANSPTNTLPADEAALATWWRGFKDARLDALIEQAITNNHDVRIATANLHEARALRGLARWDLLPTVQANGGYTHTLASKAAAPPGVSRDDREQEFYDASFDALWELDLFGRVRRSVQAANADLAAVEASRLDTLVVVTAEVARSYLELRGLQNQLAVARKNADLQAETLKLTQQRLDGGRGTDFDVSRSRSLLGLTRSTIPPLEAAIEKTMYRIAVLTGQQPVALKTELSAAAPLPVELPALTASDPSTLIRRRPDIRAAERYLAATTARIGVATGDLFPRVTFIGRIGLEANTFSGLDQASADTWSFGPRITWAALDLGRVRSRIQAADARAEAALAYYEKAVLSALEETEGALKDFAQEQAQEYHLQDSAQASQQAASLARQRYEAGATDFLTVLDAERTLLEAQNRLAVSQTRTATAYVAVFKALGGGVPVEASVTRK